MPGIFVKEGQSIDLVLKLVKKQVEKAGTIGELKRRNYYEKPSIKAKKKSAMARKRVLKQLRKLARINTIRRLPAGKVPSSLFRAKHHASWLGSLSSQRFFTIFKVCFT